MKTSGGRQFFALSASDKGRNLGWHVLVLAVLVGMLLLPLAFAGQLCSDNVVFDGLESHCLKQIELHPDLWTSYQSYAGQLLRDRGDALRALPYARKAVELAPNSSIASATYAECLLRTGQLESALEETRRSLAVKPDSPSIKDLQVRIESALAVRNESASAGR